MFLWMVLQELKSTVNTEILSNVTCHKLNLCITPLVNLLYAVVISVMRLCVIILITSITFIFNLQIAWTILQLGSQMQSGMSLCNYVLLMLV